MTLTTSCFIRSIEAVGASVTLPAAVDALPAAAGELQVRTLMSGNSNRCLRSSAAQRPLIGAVGAVHVSVAGPQTRHADGVVALEGGRAAGDRRTGRFITAIVTISLIVTHEGRRYALTTPAAKLCVRAQLWR